jgi:outer membrane protein OmpA-like peptidoglycan-associated protein
MYESVENRMRRGALIVLAALLGAGTTTRASAQPPVTYPADNLFVAATCTDPTQVPSGDSCTDDARDHRNIVGGGTSPAYQYYQDGTFLYLRVRIEDDPRQSTALQAFGWGFGIDANGNGAYEAYVSLIGQGNSDRLEILDQDPSNGTTPSLTQPMGGGTDTSLRPILTDGSGATWASVTMAGASVCIDDTPVGDWFITVAVRLSVLQAFGAIGGAVAYAGTSSEFSGVQNDFVCSDGDPMNCTSGAQCASGICLAGEDVCAPPVDPFFLGCVSTDGDGDNVDDGCNVMRPICLVTATSSSCVACLADTDCNDANGCTTDSCTGGVCANAPLSAGANCAGGVCNGSVLAPLCVTCIDDSAGQDSGCPAGSPGCDTSIPAAPTCGGCTMNTDCADTNDCTTEICTLSECATTSLPVGTPCAGGFCNGSLSEPACAGCVDDDAGNGTDTGCDMSTRYCDVSGVPTCVACLTDTDCADANDCTANACIAGVCETMSETPGTVCPTGICDGDLVAPMCLACIDDVALGGTDTGCGGITPLCDTSGARACVACIDSAVGLDTDAGCGGTTPLCTSLGGVATCVECEGDGACGSGLLCDEGAGTCVPGCDAPDDCAAPTPACDTTAEVCVVCLDDAAGGATDTGCAIGAPLCDTSGARACVVCMDTAVGAATDAGCGLGTPLCRSIGGAMTCVACENDGMCGSGLLCNEVLGTCVPGCDEASDCASPVPVCETTAQICVECLVDDDCVGRQVCGAGNACGAGDNDGDGIPDDVDVDDDDDGIPDASELGSDLSGDTDDDGVSDFEDPDAGTCTDADIDGVCDTLPASVDTDGDGVPNHFDLDTDDDGLTDVREANGTDANGDGRVDGDLDGDGDGLRDAVDPDAGGTPLGSVDTDGDATPDARDTDSDGDGISDEIESTDVNQDGRADIMRANADTDGDGLDDAFDRSTGGTTPTEPDSDDDGTPDWRDADDDGDGIPTAEERGDGGEPADSDGDGVPDYLDTIVRGNDGGVAGGAVCAATPVGARDPLAVFAMLLVLGALVSRRSRRSGIVVGLGLVALGATSTASAQGGIGLDQYRAAETPQDGFVMSRPTVLGHLDYAAQLTLDYAWNPLVYETDLGDADSEEYSVVGHHLVGNVGFAIGFVDRLMVFVNVPVSLVMRGDSTSIAGAPTADGTMMGDPTLGLRVHMYGEDDDRFALGAQLALSLPLANLIDGDQRYAGDGTLVFLPRLLAEVRTSPMRLNFQVGMRVRGVQDIESLTVGQELTYGVGAAFHAVPDKLDVNVELFGATTLGQNRTFGRENTPLEVVAGVRGFVGDCVTVGGGAGTGLLRGYGSPDLRVMATIGYGGGRCNEAPATEPEPESTPGDTDGDGLRDPDDACPNDPEDMDGFEDENGCPDPDNDRDDVLDVNDGAPNDPEDRDGFEDADGVPEPDNDRDGILDADDHCPLEPGVASHHGCPVPDRDRDTVADPVDNCPDEPGTVEHQGCAAPQLVSIVGDQISIVDNVYFRTNRDVIESRSFGLLDNVARVIVAHPEITRVRIEGHTDARGNRTRNVRLSQARAESVKRYLVAHGVGADRLEAVGFGPDRPVVPNAQTPEDHARNRRVEFHLEGAEGVESRGTGPAADTVDR